MRARWLLGLMLLPCLALAGEMYRWVDANGKVHYGDQPPPQAQREQALPDYVPGQSPQGQAAAPTPTPGAQAPQQVELTELPASRGTDPQLCAQARQRLALYQQARRLERPDEFGRARQMNDVEKQAAIDGAKQMVRRSCGEG